MNQAETVEPFNRRRRTIVRNRALSRAQGNDFLGKIMADELLDRLMLVTRDFNKCLLIGLPACGLKPKLESQGMDVFIADASWRLVDAAGGVQCDEDRLPFADHSFDLIINIGALDTVNDLPGALLLSRRILQPDGLFLASFVGAESLGTLKSLLMEAEQDKVAAHIHPQIDVRIVGDLLFRAGFTLPVVDSDSLHLTYSDFSRVLDDIRDSGGSSVLNGSIFPISKQVLNSAKQGFLQMADSDGKVTETIELIYLCGWAPHPDQPKPARRGSGQVSLKNLLQKGDSD